METALLLSNDTNPNLDVWLLVAAAFREGGDQERARIWYQKVLERDASNPKAKDGLAALGDRQEELLAEELVCVRDWI